MKYNYFIFLIIYIILLINKSNAQVLSLVQQDYACVKNLASKVFKLNNIPYTENYSATTDFYNFCNITSQIGCAPNGATNSYYIKSLTFSNDLGTSIKLNYTDFSCFTNLDSLDLTYFYFEPYKFFSLDIVNKGLARSISLYSCWNITYPLYYNSPTKIVIYTLPNTPGMEYQIKTSSLHNLTTLGFTGAYTLQPTLPELVKDEDDGILNINLKTLTLMTRAVPNLINFNLTTFILTLQNAPLSGFSNFNTYKNINNLIISSTSEAIDFPTILTVDNNVEFFVYSGKLNQPTGIVNMTPSKNLKQFSYKQDPTSLPFIYPISSKGFPFILPQSITSFSYPNVGSAQLPDFNTYLNLKIIVFYANSITTPLPEKLPSSSLMYLDVSENSITGSVSDSYCNTLLNVNSNSLIVGSMPPCFSCYYNYQNTVKQLFGGTGISIPSTGYVCPFKVIPNFSYDMNTGNFRLWGDNIGYEFPKTYPPLNSTNVIDIPNKLMTGILSDYYKGTAGGSIYSIIPVLQINFMNVNYSLATMPSIPQIENITVPDLLSNEYTFHGTYFTYNTSNITVTVDGYNCLVLEASFTSITCRVVSSDGSPILIQSNGRSFYRVNIIIGHFPLQVSVNPNKLVNPMNWCSVKCFHGFCVTSGDTSVGFCSCDNGWVGNDCNTTAIPCLNNCTSSTQGTCEPTTGICACNQGFQGVDCSGISCPNDCVNGNCNFSNGKCNCNVGFEGIDCSGLSCLPTCKNSGTCDTRYGSCICPSNWQSSDCSVPYKACNGSCNEASSSLNSCNNIIGQCKCSSDYTGPNCLIPNQYISSIEPSTTAGGTVNIYGWFGVINNDLSVSIGSLNCAIIYHDSKFLNCTAQSGSGTKTITVYQNGITWTGIDKYHYTDISYSCPNDCSSHGNCNTKFGICKCTQGWGGFDCSSLTSTPTTTTSTTTGTTTATTSSTPSPTSTPEPIIIPVTETVINTTTATAILNNEKTSFEIMITSLIEIDFIGNTVIENKLQQNWESNSGDSSNNNGKFIFIQTLKSNPNCIITYTIEELKESRDYIFAELDLSLDAGSIKISVSISNYTYSNSLNTLQLQMESKIGDKPIDQSNKCNQQETNIDQSKLDKNQLLNYLTISKDSKKLFGRFINRVESDSKSTFITTSIISSDNSGVVIGLNLPHCTNLLIDPDFSVLVQSTYKECDNGGGNNNRKWVLPVAIVVPCVFVVALIIGGVIVYTKNRTSILLAKEKYSFKLGRLSKKQRDGLYMPNKN